MGKDEYGYNRSITINGYSNTEWDLGKEGEFVDFWENKIRQCIQNNLGTAFHYNIEVSFGHTTSPYLINSKTNDVLRDKMGNGLILDTWRLYHPKVRIQTDAPNSATIQDADYSDCLHSEDLKSRSLYQSVEQKVGISSSPELSLEKGDILIDGYRDTIKKEDKIYEQEYSIRYVQVITNALNDVQ